MNKHSNDLKLFFSGIFFLILFLFSCVDKKHSHYKLPPGGCCLASGTNVRLANGKDLPIENLVAGDTVLGFDRMKNIFVPSVVKKMFSTEHAGFVKLRFDMVWNNNMPNYSPGNCITVSNDHPIWIRIKGWCSNDPEMTKRVLMLPDVKQLVITDHCSYYSPSLENHLDEGLQLISIEKINEPVKAFSIVQLENNLDCFVANGIVVGTEAIQAEDGGE